MSRGSVVTANDPQAVCVRQAAKKASWFDMASTWGAIGPLRWQMAFRILHISALAASSPETINLAGSGGCRMLYGAKGNKLPMRLLDGSFRILELWKSATHSSVL